MSSGTAADNAAHTLEQAEDTIVLAHTPQEGSSDGEGGERSAREKLKKTSIAGLSQLKAEAAGDHPLSESTTGEPVTEPPAENGLRGRPSKKRSFEDLQNEDPGLSIENGGPPVPKKGQHKRMRSREISGTDHIQSLDKLDDIASPVQEESDAEAEQSPGGPGVLVAVPSKEEREKTATAVEAKEKKNEGESTSALASEQEPATTTDPASVTSSTKDQEPEPQVPASSGFANTSTTSPFSNFKSPKSPTKETETPLSPGTSTSTTAFASSGLSAFASSEKSPFGTVGASSKATGGFGGGTTSSGFGSTAGGFGAPSPFASKPLAGFGSGGGFGSAGGFGAATKPFGTGLSSFAGPAGGAGTFGKPKPFAKTTEDDEDASDNGADEEEAQPGDDSTDQDPRFKERDIETGEEEEETIFSCRAKLYHFEKEWKEHGVGVLKINIRYEAKSAGGDPEDDTVDDKEKSEEVNDERDVEGGFAAFERRARLIMRADGTHRLVLNTPVFKEMNVGTHDGNEPSGRTMHLTGLEEGKPTGFQIKVGKEDALKEIYRTIRELQEDL